jgi:hypothetical protein
MDFGEFCSFAEGQFAADMDWSSNGLRAPHPNPLPNA